MGQVVGSFANNESAVAAVRALSQAGFSLADIGVLSREHDWTEKMKQDLSGTKMEEGAGIGAAAGAAAGVGLGLAVAVGLLQPLGPALAGGTLIGLLASAGSGAAAGAVIGGLVGLGVPEDEAQFFEHEYRAGRILVTVAAGARRGEAEDLLRRLGARMHRRAASAV